MSLLSRPSRRLFWLSARLSGFRPSRPDVLIFSTDSTTKRRLGDLISMIMKDDHLPPCAVSSNELVQIPGEAPVVRKALFQIADHLRDNPSRSQHILMSAAPNAAYLSGGSLMGPTASAPIKGLTPLMDSYGGYKGESRYWSRSFYLTPRDELSSKEFSLHLVCSTANIGGVMARVVPKSIKSDKILATIKVYSSAAAGDDCIISISAKEVFEDTFSPTTEAAMRLQLRCSDKVERDSGLISFTTCLLVSSSWIGCLIGKGRGIITIVVKAWPRRRQGVQALGNLQGESRLGT